MNLGGGGSGGEGQSTTETQASFPPEFRPLAESAVPQIQATQKALPLVRFAEPFPAQVAGLSPLLVEALRLALLTSFKTPEEQALARLTFPIREIVAQIPRFAEPSPGAQGALRTLGERLGGAPLTFEPIFPTGARDLLAAMVLGPAASIPTGAGGASAFSGNGTSLAGLPAVLQPAESLGGVPIVTAPVIGPGAGAGAFVPPPTAPAAPPAPPVVAPSPFPGQTPLLSPVVVSGVGVAFTVEQLEALRELEGFMHGSA